MQWFLTSVSNLVSAFFLQKHEKPKYVLCVTFSDNGDAITGDSSGNIYVWARGTLQRNQNNPNISLKIIGD